MEWNLKDLTHIQIKALRAIAAAGEDGLPERANGTGRVSVNGNTEHSLKGFVAYRGKVRDALIERRDHGHLRVMRARMGGGYDVDIRDNRHHLTEAGRRLLALLDAADAVRGWRASKDVID